MFFATRSVTMTRIPEEVHEGARCCVRLKSATFVTEHFYPHIKMKRFVVHLGAVHGVTDWNFGYNVLRAAIFVGLPRHLQQVKEKDKKFHMIAFHAHTCRSR